MLSKNKFRWYVYHLIDPETNKVFYIGKGSGNRVDQHENEAKKGVCSHKCNKIRSITTKGINILKDKIAFFCDEKEAYDFETESILSVGLENLTNVMPGGQGAWTKRKEAYYEKKKTVDHIKILTDYAWATKLVIDNPNSSFIVEESTTASKIQAWIINAFLNVMIPKSLKEIENDKDKMDVVYKAIGYGC